MHDAYVYLLDTDDTYRASVYLPGATYRGPDAETCILCDNPLSEAGTANPRTGAPVPQDPETGAHDGIVTFWYANVSGGATMEQDPCHLRCLVESGSVLTIGEPPESTGKHARVAA